MAAQSRPQRTLDDAQTCPCGRGRAYGRCCGKLHNAGSAGLGTTPEDTMRARFSAYVLGDEAFLLATWHPRTRPDGVSFPDDVTWETLQVIDATGGSFDARGTVTFKARFRRNGTPLELHELSSFERLDGNWVYLEGADPDQS